MRQFPPDVILDGSLIYEPIKPSLAHISIEQKKTLVITEPLSYTEYNQVIDIKFDSSNSKPIICIPVFNREMNTRVEGCIEIEFKMKHYLASNPFTGGSYQGREFKLDFVTKE
jgi:hypothetical protein